ncbi:MAG: hypothetical protein ABL917_01100 [Parcubacteria group bacterium]
MKTKIAIGVIIFAIIVLSFVGLKKYSNQHKADNTPNSNVIFQPEGQMVTQGVETSKKLSEASSSSISQKASSIKSCEGNSVNLYKCFAKYYKELVIKSGATFAIEDMKKRSSDDYAVLSLCHPLMHVVGRQASESYKTVSEAFSKADSFCWSGYHHGIMEGIIERIGIENLATELNTICADVPGKERYTFDYYNCVHGLGHGIMAELDDEVLESLAMCDNLEGSWEEQSCYSGVYMQNIIDSTNVADSGNTVKYLKPEEPMYPCNIVAEKYKGQCYLGQTSYALQVSGNNLKKVFGMCANVNQPYRDICNQSMGRDIANQVAHDPTGTKNNCSIAVDLNDINNCLIGAVKEIISYYHSDTQAYEFCAILEDAYKNTCTDTTKSYYSVFK